MLYEFLKKMHGLGSEQYIIIVIFCLCASKPLNCILSDNFGKGSKTSESLKHEIFIFQF